MHSNMNQLTSWVGLSEMVRGKEKGGGGGGGSCKYRHCLVVI